MVIYILVYFLFTNTITNEWLLPQKYCLEKKTDECQDNVQVYVNSLYSQKQLVTVDYSYSNFCLASQKTSTNIGQKTLGDNLMPSEYIFKFNTNVTCSTACNGVFNEKQLTNLKTVITGLYQHHWEIDSLPLLNCTFDKNTKSGCSLYFYVGCTILSQFPSAQCGLPSHINSKDFIIANHVKFIIYFRKLPDYANFAEIMQVYIKPSSQKECGSSDFADFKDSDKSLNIPFTYSVEFIRDDHLSYQSRYNYMYLITDPGHIRWLSITISLFLMLVLSSITGYLLVRAVRTDISRYTELLNTGFDTQDEYGWKLLKGDIFRAPKYRLLLSVSVGNGIQIVLITLISLLLLLAGYYSYQTRGYLITYLITFYILLSFLGGFVSARIYKFFDGERWKLCVLASALLHPGIIFATLILIDFVIRLSSPGRSISFLTLFELFALWTFFSIPLTFVGALLGFKKRAIKSPVKKNLIPRTIPRQIYYNKPLFSFIVGSFICFVSIFFQLFYVMRSIWLRHSYVMLGFLFTIACIFVVVCAEISIVFCYFHLCSEDYRWQWRSFLTVAFTAVYSLIYFVYQYLTTPGLLLPLGAFVFLGYYTLIMYMMFLACGSIGFLACFYTLLKMFSSIKVE